MDFAFIAYKFWFLFGVLIREKLQCISCENKIHFYRKSKKSTVLWSDLPISRAFLIDRIYNMAAIHIDKIINFGFIPQKIQNVRKKQKLHNTKSEWNTSGNATKVWKG